MTKTKFVLLFLSVVLMVGNAMALIVPDDSFEDAPEVPDGGFAYVKDVSTPWFRTLNGGEPWIGKNYIDDGGSPQGGDGFPQVGYDSDSYAYINYSYIHQQLEATYTDGVTYELTLWCTTRLDEITDQLIYGSFTVGGDGDGWTNATELYIDSQQITNSTSTHTWYEHTFAYTAGAAEAGQPIGIALFGDYIMVDNITLVPEPMTIALLGLGTVMIRRRKR